MQECIDNKQDLSCLDTLSKKANEVFWSGWKDKFSSSNGWYYTRVGTPDDIKKFCKFL